MFQAGICKLLKSELCIYPWLRPSQPSQSNHSPEDPRLQSTVSVETTTPLPSTPLGRTGGFREAGPHSQKMSCYCHLVPHILPSSVGLTPNDGSHSLLSPHAVFALLSSGWWMLPACAREARVCKSQVPLVLLEDPPFSDHVEPRPAVMDTLHSFFAIWSSSKSIVLTHCLSAFWRSAAQIQFLLPSPCLKIYAFKIKQINHG